MYGYRTKLTPHFGRPPKPVREQELISDEYPSWLKIGFNMMIRTTTMDILEVGFIFIYFTFNTDTEPSLKGVSDSCSNFKMKYIRLIERK